MQHRATSLLALIILGASSAWAQQGRTGPGNMGVQQGIAVERATAPTQKGPPIRPGLHGVFSPGGNYTFPSDFEGGGHLSVSRESLAVGAERIATNGAMVGVVLEREYSRYDLSADGDPVVADTDHHVNSTRLGINARQPLTETRSLFASADTTFSVADGADWDDGQTFGGLVSLRQGVSDRFAWMIGVVVRTRLDDRLMALPIPGFDWQITDRISLRTAQGLTLTWQIDDRRRWSADASANYESRSFRLGDDEPLPNGTVNERRVPLVIGLRYQPHPALFARVYGGMVVAQQMEFDDDSGDDVERRSVDPTPIAGVAAGLRF